MSYVLANILQHREWARRTYPFPHVTARDVFTLGFQRTLREQFDALLARGLSETPDPAKLSRNITGYDTYAFGFGPEQTGAFGLFLSRAWHDMLAKLFDVKATGHVNCGLHYHPVGSESGWVHNDLNPGWFAQASSVDGIVCAQPQLCSYVYGKPSHPNVKPLETIRSVALLYYLGNPAWSAGDGGVTGLYPTKDTPVHLPAAVVPPIDNSLVAFECTPYSFHTFIRNTRAPRACIVMWLHRQKQDVIDRWGERKIVQWPRGR